MLSAATSVPAYLKGLPEDRRKALEAIRKVIKANLDPRFEEGIQYGMIGYFVPHSIYPAGYHCDPRQPLPFMSIASQKNHMALYMFCLYMSPADLQRFEKEWRATGKRLDMGKSCVRFKKLDDVALEAVGAAIGRITTDEYIANYELQYGAARKPARKAAPDTANAKKAGAKKAGTSKAGAKPARKSAKTGTRKKASR